MSRKKSAKVLQFAPPPPMETVVPSHPEIEPSRGDEPILIVEDVYSFPTRSRCPKCSSLSTRATSTRGSVQLRRCRRPSCGFTYKEAGSKV